MKHRTEIFCFHVHLQKWEGMFVDMLKILQSQLNFTYKITEPVDKSYGNFINGSWNGFIGALEKKTIDLVMADLAITQERSEVVDFTTGLIKIDNKVPINNGQV